MASIAETGHAKNVANFKELITIVKSFGAQYQPVASFLKIPALEEQAQKAEDALHKLREAETLAKQATATLQGHFKSLNTLASQLMGLLSSSGAKTSSIEEARSIQKRITGSNNRKKKTEGKDGDATDTKASRSTSRQSYDSRLDAFSKFVMVLQNIPEYLPNEDEFKVSTLEGKIKLMKQAIEENDNKELVRSQAMHERNALLYTESLGVINVSLMMKEYVKGVFGGVKSTQYKTISKIRIVKVAI